MGSDIELTNKSAIHLAITNIPIFSPADTINHILKDLGINAGTYESINYLYIVDDMNHLMGVISVQELMSAPTDQRIGQHMKRKIVSVRPYTHQERIVHVALQNSIKAVPVVDKEGNFHGVIPSDTILRVANSEITEDMLILEGIHAKEYNAISTLNNSSYRLLIKRLPWLIVGLIGGLIAARIIGFFEAVLEAELLLVTFLPLMVYMSDAVGSQSQTIFIRYLALNNSPRFTQYLTKEISISIFIALSLSFMLSIIVLVFYTPHLSLVVGISLFCTVVISVIVAILVPWMLTALKRDPALGSGPFATIVRDVMSIFIYFTIAYILYLS